MKMKYKLFHPLNRPGQPEAMEWILNSNKKFNILCAPTGFGKSPLAATASIDYRTMALVLHKSLQTQNYQEQYQFEPLFGKSNYPCVKKNENQQAVLFGNPVKYTANDCDERHCDCPYQQQLQTCMMSNRVTLNYAKFQSSRKFSEGYETKYLFLDEAHNLPNIVMNFVGFTIDWDNEFLQSGDKIKPGFEGRLTEDQAITLFTEINRVVRDNKPDEKDIIKHRRWKRLQASIFNTSEALAGARLADWYYEADEKQLIIKPLTAKYHFKNMFGNAKKVILMSATIGPSIASRLGLRDDEWDYHEVANPWPVPTRLIYDLGGPSININSSDRDRTENAKLIASVLRPDRSGVIHVTSKAQAYNLKYLLEKYQDEKGQLQFLLFIPTVGIGTEKQYDEWTKVRQPGTYVISWNFHEGVDLGLDDIEITAKIPWINFSSNYEKARKAHDIQWYMLQAAMKTQQCTGGRTRRGKPEHYVPGAKQVYIADSSWKGLKTLLSDEFRRSIRKYNGN